LSLRRQLAVSFAVQGAGAASLLLATLWLGAHLGPEVQGGFSRAKSEVEFVGAVAMFGLPQALFFHVKSGGLSLNAAMHWAAGSALLALLIGAAYGLVAHAGSAVWTLAALSAAMAACVAHGQLRALLLVRERTAVFNAVTALPQMLMLAGVALLIGSGDLVPSIWFVVFMFAFGSAALLAWQSLHAVSPPPTVSTVGWRALGHYGLAAWLTAALSTAAILAVQRWVEATQGRAALGQFTLAMTLVQVPLTPISYAAPLLLGRWMDRPGARGARRGSGIVFAMLLGLAAAMWLAASAWPDLGLGPAYAGAGRALAVLLVGGAAEAVSRLWTVQASASGLPWVGVRAEAARWAVLAVGAALPLPPGLQPLCVVWAAAAGAAALVFVAHARGAR
jgi:hypothetical protein